MSLFKLNTHAMRDFLKQFSLIYGKKILNSQKVERTRVFSLNIQNPVVIGLIQIISSYLDLNPKKKKKKTDMVFKGEHKRHFLVSILATSVRNNMYSYSLLHALITKNDA